MLVHDQSSALLTDTYQVNMAYAHFKAGTAGQMGVFDLFFRSHPCGNGYAVAAGLEQAIEFIRDFGFSPDDLEYLRSVHPYEDDFLQYLAKLRFSGEIMAVPEGTVVFANEPLLRVRAPMVEAHLLETALLAIVNHQTLIATKAARVCEAAGETDVVEFGLRRAHGPQAGVYGARAAYIGGAVATSNMMAGKRFGIPVRGTLSHAYIQRANSELEAFRSFAAAFPQGAILLVDTYDTLRSGLPNAIRVFREMKQKLGEGFTRFGIRLDSGDLAYLSKECRRRLDEAGFDEAIIVASSDLDELLIRDLLAQGARIDSWGVGTRLITSAGCPALGGVFKLAAVEEAGRLVPRIKVSDNPAKVISPGVKKLVRFHDRDTGVAIVDLIMLDEEPIPTGEFVAFDPNFPWKRKTVHNFTARELLVPIFESGRQVYTPPPLEQVRSHALTGRGAFPPEVRRLLNPHEYHVDLSEALWQLKNRLIGQFRHTIAP